MKPRILLIGATGQIGSELFRLLPALGQVLPLGRSDLDLADPAAIRPAIRAIAPKLIVNAAAYTAVDRAETEPAAAQAVNSVAPAVLAEEARKLDATLVHFSTDYVFDGRKSAPYEETDPAKPINVYGSTKLAGENAIRAAGVRHLVFRTSWVYAPRGKNFLLTILRLAAEREELRVVSDQIGAPTWSREIAAAAVQVLAQVLGAGSLDWIADPTAGGIYHMTASGAASWFEFATSILDEARPLSPVRPWVREATSSRPLIAQRVVPIASRDYPTPALRPAYSVLSNARLERAFGVRLPDWRSQLKALFDEQ